MAEHKRARLWSVRVVFFLLINLLVTLTLVLSALMYGWTNVARGLPTLRGWHRQAPADEFRAIDASDDYSFADYLAQESRVFEQLQEFVTGPWAAESAGVFCRFQEDSVCNPEQAGTRNWNRTYVLESSNPVGGVLLVHGLSDSPYSLRSLGERLNAEGFTVIGLRVPGHGTCPKALAEVRWEDWTAAVRVAVESLHAGLPEGVPLLLAGYSNGGALSVDYALSAIEDTTLPRPDGLLLFSPMLGIHPLAGVTRLYKPIMRATGIEKMAWSGINAEIDPFKYSSWPTNASVQAAALTRRVEERLAAMYADGRIAKFPPVLAFQSAVDSTVSTTKLIRVLFERLDAGTSELVLFDVNRAAWLQGLIDTSFEDTIRDALKDSELRYQLTVVTNVNTQSRDVLARTRHGSALTETPLGLAWPREVFSLSHVAIPIPPTDPIYGPEDLNGESRLPLGSLSFRGEQGALMISDGLAIRLRYNPFYEFVEQHVFNWLEELQYSAGTDGSAEKL